MDLPLWLLIGISVVIYCLSVSAVPIYNKLVFSGLPGGNSLGVRKYPYPIATAFLQLGLVALCLGFASIAGHFCRRRDDRRSRSWLLGPHFYYKLQHAAPVGLLFGLKYGVTNWGLELVPVGIHLLLQSSDLLWTVVTARILNKEKPGILEQLAALLSTAGSVMIAMHAVQTLDAPLVPLLVNLLTPLMLALCVSTLRTGAQELFRPDNQLQGTISATEFTAIKLALSSSTALLLAMIIEGNGGIVEKPPWWTALAEQPAEGVLAVLFGGIFVLIFQVNLTWLAALTSALTVGIVGGLKVVPQWLLNAAFQLQVNLSPLNVLGATFVLCASALYGFACSLKRRLVLGPDGFTWESVIANGEDDKKEPLLRTEEEEEQLRRSGSATPCLKQPDFVLDAQHFFVEAPARMRSRSI